MDFLCIQGKHLVRGLYVGIRAVLGNRREVRVLFQGAKRGAAARGGRVVEGIPGSGPKYTHRPSRRKPRIPLRGGEVGGGGLASEMPPNTL